MEVMTLRNVIRAWTDPVYRASLGEAERAQLPENPAGIIELTGTELEFVAGGGHTASARSSSSRSSSSRSESSSSSGNGGPPPDPV